MLGDTSETLARTFLCCLLYRLGGEQTFTTDEITDMVNEYRGVRFLVNSEGTAITLRIQNKEHVDQALERGTIL